MITVKEACNIVSKNISNDQKVYSCREGKKYYKFIISDLNNNVIGNSLCYSVNKNTGEYICDVFPRLNDDIKYDQYEKDYNLKDLEAI